MKGDKLARGAKSADFSMVREPTDEPVAGGHSRVEVQKPKTEFACKDCDFVGATAAEFCDHIRVCPVNPIYSKEVAA